LLCGRIEAYEVDIQGVEQCEPRSLRVRKPSDIDQREDDLILDLAFEGEEVRFATLIDRAHHAWVTAWQGIARTQRSQTLQAQVVGTGGDEVVGLHQNEVGPGFFKYEQYLHIRTEASEVDKRGVEECELRPLCARKPSSLGQREEDLIPGLAFEAEEVRLELGIDAAISDQ